MKWNNLGKKLVRKGIIHFSYCINYLRIYDSIYLEYHCYWNNSLRIKFTLYNCFQIFASVANLKMKIYKGKWNIDERDGDVRDTQEKGVREEGGNICLSLSDIWKTGSLLQIDLENNLYSK